jgi:hypothetical protein
MTSGNNPRQKPRLIVPSTIFRSAASILGPRLKNTNLTITYNEAIPNRVLLLLSLQPPEVVHQVALH